MPLDNGVVDTACGLTTHKLKREQAAAFTVTTHVE